MMWRGYRVLCLPRRGKYDVVCGEGGGTEFYVYLGGESVMWYIFHLTINSHQNSDFLLNY